MFDTIKILRSKTVKTTKKHDCWKCRCIIKKGVKVEFDVLTVNGEICNTYKCNKCSKKQKAFFKAT